MLNDFNCSCPVYIACGYTDLRRGIDGYLVGTGISSIAEKAVTNWKNSSGHLETMVDGDYEEVGVGVTIDNSRIFCYMFAGAPGTYNPYG